MQTKINPLLRAGLSLLVTFGLTHSAAAQNERIVFYGPVTTTVTQKGKTVSTTITQIMTMNVDGTDVRQLTTGTENCYFPNWRPPGKTHILFHRGTSLYVMDANGAGMFAVATAQRDGADWSPNGSMICYVGDALSPPGPL